MSQRAGEDHPQHNVSDAIYEVAGRDKSQTSPAEPYIPRNWPDDVRAIKSPKGVNI
jgi:hypothetical protein